MNSSQSIQWFFFFNSDAKSSLTPKMCFLAAGWFLKIIQTQAKKNLFNHFDLATRSECFIIRHYDFSLFRTPKSCTRLSFPQDGTMTHLHLQLAISRTEMVSHLILKKKNERIIYYICGNFGFRMVNLLCPSLYIS